MQILGKRSKILLIALAIIMLVAIGISFAAWDSMLAVKATAGNTSTYANAKVGDKITFGNYYQNGSKTGDRYSKQPITWIVVDKDERTGQLTLLSEKILATGSYFGNQYSNTAGNWGAHYDGNASIAKIQYNQAYVDSTVRAYLNNLERLDMGGDEFTIDGYLPSNKNSTMETGLLSNVGFSNKLYWTNQRTDNNGQSSLLSKPGFIKRTDNNEIYYQRPITTDLAYLNRPATLGFYDEAFSDEEKSIIVPKVIAGYTGHRWPDNASNISTKSYVEGAYDKIWIPSATELNVMKGQDWRGLDDNWTNPSDEAGSTVFEYFKNFKDYGFVSVAEAIKATRTEFAKNSFAMSYSIPVYNKGTSTANTNINKTANSTDHYWTRSPLSSSYNQVRFVDSSGLFGISITNWSDVGVRPCIILKY